MKAARIHSYGDVKGLRVDDDAPRPEPAPDQVLVEVHASSVNPIDTKIRKGAFQGALRYTLPRTIGLDVSGVVRAVGRNVTRWKVGDEVIASPGPNTPGTYAEFTCVPERELGRKPKNLSHEEAASLPLCFLTAWQALVDKGNVRPGQKVFIQVGSGGVGSLAIQIAKHLGAHVATTCSARNAELVRSLGADEVIDYQSQSYLDVLSDYDFVLEAVSFEEVARSRRVLKKGGKLVSISSGLPERTESAGPIGGLVTTALAVAGRVIANAFTGVPSWFITRVPDGAQLDHMADLCEAGVIRPVIDSVLSLDQIREAHTRSESGRARGKIVIAIRSAGTPQ